MSDRVGICSMESRRTTVDGRARRGVVPLRKRGRRRIFLRGEIGDWLDG